MSHQQAIGAKSLKLDSEERDERGHSELNEGNTSVSVDTEETSVSKNLGETVQLLSEKR